MTFLTLLSFGAAMFVLAASPGPGVFATVARALASGFASAAVLVLGIITGDLIFLLLAIYGLSSVAELLGSFFILVKYAGGIYLIWLGIKIWQSSPQTSATTKTPKLRAKQTFTSGLLITLANPKVIFFYLGFLPTFVDLNSLTHTDVISISCVMATVLATVLLFYAWTAARTKQLFSNSRTVTNINRCAGGVMITAGSLLLLKK